MNRQIFNAMIAQYKTETVTDTNQVIEWSDGAHCYLPSLKFYGLSEQRGTPTPDSPLPVSAFDGTATVSGRGSYLFTPKLHGIGEYKDEWDYVTGKGVRNVASITLDGVSDGKKALSVALASKTGTYYAIFYIPHKSHHAQFGLLLSSHFKSEWTHSVGTAYVSGSGSYEYKQILAYHTDQTLTTAAQWNTWLKAQYDAGTPVVFYYALAEPQPFEERPSYQPYEPIPNEGGVVDIIDSGMNTPFELSYVTHSSGLKINNLLNLAKREVVNFGNSMNTAVRSFTGNGIIVGVSFNNYYYSPHILQFEQYNNGFEFTRNNQSAYGIGFDLKVSPNTNYICAFDELESRSDNAVQLAEYDSNGNWLRSVNPKNSSLTGKSRLIQTSADAVWGVFVFRNPDSEKVYRYSNVSIRKE
jgi:hypothetical protein